MGPAPYYLIAYLSGSIPFGWLVARARGVDIREVGSGNIGATNVGRVLGKPYAVLVFSLDLAKGLLPVWAAQAAFEKNPVPGAPWHLLGIALLAVLGHNHPVWLKFKGGKGVATSAGALAALLPVPLLIAAAVWVLFFYSLRYVSVASLAAMVSLPIATWFLKPEPAYLALTGVLVVFSFIRHRSNIAALIAGTERRFDRKPKQESAP